VKEQSVFGCRSADGREAAKPAVRSDDAMARDNQGDGIAGHGTADGPGRSSSPRAGREFGIGLRLSEADPSARQEDITLESAQVGQVDRWISTEINVFALEVRDDTLLKSSTEVFLV